MTPIQTRYAGCHFRSRLEARWAVYFDTVGFKWEYEPEGLEVNWRLQLDDKPFAYLPDFWLPEARTWVEVKGDPTDNELDRLLNIAAWLSTGGGGGCGEGNDLLLCGPFQHVPPASTDPVWGPTLLHMHKGDLVAIPSSKNRHSDHGITIARDVGGDVYGEVGHTLDTIRPILFDHWAEYSPVHAIAVAAARSARFEHGQSGAA